MSPSLLPKSTHAQASNFLSWWAVVCRDELLAVLSCVGIVHGVFHSRFLLVGQGVGFNGAGLATN